ncbi:hypothetical protein GE09DRAFT_1064368 [Coniochaeta sp. 2T2.1]|nr:hypothetical protein GE09DRAFT_1064368 [Coniochaeta sp. 2T2.1]
MSGRSDSGEEIHIKSSYYGNKDMDWVPDKEVSTALAPGAFVLVERPKNQLDRAWSYVNRATMLDPKATDFQPDQFDKLVIDEEGQWHRDKEEMLSCNNFSAMYDMPERWNYSLDPENGKMEDILGEEEGHAPTLSVMAKTTRGQQEGVNTWYGKRCVLSGGHTATGGCIVPTSKASNGLWHSVFYALKEWYPDRVLRRYHQLLKGKTRGSIFPLSPDFLELWNKNHFGLRPIRHPTDPKGRMFIQVDFRMAYDFTTGERLEARDRNIPALAHLQTGDVFELVTDGAEKYPLPNFELLELRCWRYIEPTSGDTNHKKWGKSRITTHSSSL